ncbi:MAG TPA: hypothetical protein VFJ84_00650 [Candidatus Saccharimonadales bacterium]|nr:hypothetical protein [Candidatus Saccharimonadales bacterium]
MLPGLHHYEEFQDVLSSYSVSEDSKKILYGLKFVLLLGPSSGGRNTIIRHQVQTGRYYYVISDTTRPPRLNDGILEQDGVEYWFRTEEEMLEDLRAGRFLEAELIHGQQVSGLSIRELAKAHRHNKIAIADVDLKGIHAIVKIKPDTFVIMVLPPSFDEWQSRLNKRGVMALEEQRRRLMTAQRIFEDGLKQDYYHYIISEDVERSSGIIDDILNGGANPHQEKGRALLEELLVSLRRKLTDLG